MATLTATALAMCRAGEDVTIRQIAMIGYLAKTKRPEERTVRAAAEALDISKPAVSNNAAVLEKMKLVERNPDPADRRSVLLEITSEGAVFVRRLNSGWSEAA